MAEEDVLQAKDFPTFHGRDYKPELTVHSMELWRVVIRKKRDGPYMVSTW
jgi:hypothetical protein